MPGREDFILKFIALLRQAISQMIKLRTTGRYNDALDTALQAQEKLFARPTAELAKLSLDELIRLLRVDETAAGGDEKVIGYGMLLRETGLIYTAMDKAQAAESCYQLALQVLLTVVNAQPEPAVEHWDTIRDLLERIPPEQLHAPVREMIRRAGR